MNVLFLFYTYTFYPLELNTYQFDFKLHYQGYIIFMSFPLVYLFIYLFFKFSLYTYISLSARILHRAPPRLQVDQNFLTQKIVADPKMRCHQKSFGIWKVTEVILCQKTCFFSKKRVYFQKTYFGKKFIINHTISLIFRF